MPQTILFLAANPKNTNPLRLDEECRDIAAGLERSQHRDQFRFQSKWAVRVKDLRRAMLDWEPQILHFSGHGLGEGGLVFENETGNAQRVSGSALAGLCQLCPGLNCVVLNGCYSTAQAQEIQQYVPYVIGMNSAIADKAARVFAEAFYDALGAGRPVESAYDVGVNALELEGLASEASIPVLLAQSSAPLSTATDSPDNPDDIAVITHNGRRYVVRAELEQRCQEEIQKGGSLIRLRSPDKMGKSLMLGRILAQAEARGYRTARVDLREANQTTFDHINNFLQWLCFYVGDLLDLDDDPSATWKSFLGANPNCTKFFEKKLLAPFEAPLVLAIDNFDVVYEHPTISEDFYGLLRGWFEKVNTRPVWGKLRQIIAYPKEFYATENINQSPFNVGLPIELMEFTRGEVGALARAYGVDWQSTELDALMAMIGGHPYLVQQTLDKWVHETITLDAILASAPTEAGIYSEFLRDRLLKLQSNPDLVTAMGKLVAADCPVRLSPKDSFQLDSMGLTSPQESDRGLRCQLYRLYFQDRLQ